MINYIEPGEQIYLIRKRSNEYSIVEDTVDYVIERRFNTGAPDILVSYEYKLMEHGNEKFCAYCASREEAERIVRERKPRDNVCKYPSSGSDCGKIVFVIVSDATGLGCSIVERIVCKVVKTTIIRGLIRVKPSDSSFKLLLDDGQWYSRNNANIEQKWFPSRELARMALFSGVKNLTLQGLTQTKKVLEQRNKNMKGVVRDTVTIPILPKGTEVYIPKKKYIETTCTTCKGTGKLYCHDGDVVDCISCNGTGKLHHLHCKHVIQTVPTTITDVYVNYKDQDGSVICDVTYGLEHGMAGICYHEVTNDRDKHLGFFLSKEACEAAYAEKD